MLDRILNILVFSSLTLLSISMGYGIGDSLAIYYSLSSVEKYIAMLLIAFAYEYLALVIYRIVAKD